MSNEHSRTNRKSSAATNHSSSSSMTASFHERLQQQQKQQSKNLTTDQLLVQLMNKVNAAVKASEYSGQLADDIFSLCQQFRTNGQRLEQSHKSDLNKVFGSLRQACCRDNGQLGTPCRLKIMELIELRAMNWKTNLSHSQYYLNKAEKVNSQSVDDQPAKNASSTSSNKNHPSPHQSANQAQKSDPPTFSHSNRAFIQAPPQQQQPSTIFQQPLPVTMNMQIPQQFGQVPQQLQYAQPPPPPMFMASELSPGAQPAMQGPSGYFLIPATGSWTPQMIPAGMMPSPQYGPPPPHHQLRHQAPPPADWLTRSAIIGAVSSHFKSNNSNPMMSQSTHLPNSNNGANSKSSKQPQHREEVTIRNADSGKIMGVKGRRVSAVEEMSKTVISFQKVDANSPYRTLAITGTSQESIQHAKRLIEETIRRNVSPNRLELNGHQNPQQSIVEPESRVIGVEKQQEESDGEDSDDPGISIETAQDGSLKLSCTDPEMLQAAQQALTQYLTLRTNRMTSEQRKEQKERRKSMPLQASSTTNGSASVLTPPDVRKTEVVEETNISGGSLGEASRRALVGSTPNLLADLDGTAQIPDESPSKNEEQKPLADTPTQKDQPLRYERGEIMSLREKVREELGFWANPNDDDLPFISAASAESETLEEDVVATDEAKN